MKTVPRRLLCAALGLAIANPAAAAEVHLKDGSVVIGTIEKLTDGEDLRVDTEHMDLVTIEWDAVKEIRGGKGLVLELYSGERLSGDISLQDKRITVIGRDGQQRVVEPEQVFGLEDLADDFWSGISAHTDLGANLVRGNNRVTQYSFGAGVEYDAEHFDTGIEGTSLLNQQQEGTDTRRNTVNAYYSHKFANNWQAGGMYQFESDGQQQLVGRSLVAGMVGNRVINQRRTRVMLLGGLAVNSEEFEQTQRSETLEGLLGATYRLRSAWDLDIDAGLMVFPNLEESGRTRVQFDSSLSLDLFKDLDFKLTFYDRYDSDPPLDNEKNDYGVTVGLSWEL